MNVYANLRLLLDIVVELFEPNGLRWGCILPMWYSGITGIARYRFIVLGDEGLWYYHVDLIICDTMTNMIDVRCLLSD